ncbi:MAG: HNH endonuclease, partial [Nocardioides sp.]|nr:HNH endonuclease [Nocardioides sp.]
AEGLPISCEVCAFDFGATYGALGEGYVEVHHRLPLHASGPVKTRLEDLALLCSNCHRMIHRARPWLTPEGLGAVVRRQQAS